MKEVECAERISVLSEAGNAISLALTRRGRAMAGTASLAISLVKKAKESNLITESEYEEIMRNLVPGIVKAVESKSVEAKKYLLDALSKIEEISAEKLKSCLLG